MKIVINLTDIYFAYYLINKLQEWFYSNFNRNKVSKIEPFFELMIGRKLDLKYICYLIFNSLDIKRYDNRIEIMFDESVKIPETQIKVIDIIKLINYGNLIIQPYPIFTEMFDSIKENISNYYNLYVLGV